MCLFFSRVFPVVRYKVFITHELTNAVSQVHTCEYNEYGVMQCHCYDLVDVVKDSTDFQLARQHRCDLRLSYFGRLLCVVRHKDGFRLWLQANSSQVLCTVSCTGSETRRQEVTG